MWKHHEEMTAEQLEARADHWGHVAREMAVKSPENAQAARELRATTKADAREKRSRRSR